MYVHAYLIKFIALHGLYYIVIIKIFVDCVVLLGISYTSMCANKDDYYYKHSPSS